jgi:hypothetical protein|tara:strand:+ start:16704 stop:16889 length:186 start_codon:yes stop_codon:yes gene_type:complete
MTDRARGRFQTKRVPTRAFVARARHARPSSREALETIARASFTDSTDRVRALASLETTAME